MFFDEVVGYQVQVSLGNTGGGVAKNAGQAKEVAAASEVLGGEGVAQGVRTPGNPGAVENAPEGGADATLGQKSPSFALPDIFSVADKQKFSY